MFCFIHIEKTAGITIHHIFKNNSFRYVTLSPWSIWANDLENVLTVQEARLFFKLFPYITGFGGHTPRAYLEYEKVIHKSIDYITFLREPVSRFLSQYFYHKNVMKIDWTIEKFIEAEHFNNFMTKRICGRDDPDAAIQMLTDKFRFVGIIEKFDESLLLLKHRMNWTHYRMQYEIKNRTPRKETSEITETVMTRIREVNVSDQLVYEFVLNELFPEYVKNYGSGLETDVQAFRETLKNFRFNRYKLWFHGLLRHLVYRPVERGLHTYYHREKKNKQADDQ